MTILTNTVQPDLLTVLSSSSKPAISPLFKACAGSSDRADSFIAVLPDELCGENLNTLTSAEYLIHHTHSKGESSVSRERPTTLVPLRPRRGAIAGPVIHLQSPEWRSTYLQAGSRKGKEKERLGIELEWLGMNVRPLGSRPWGFEVGIVDARGVQGIIKASSLTMEAIADLTHQPPIIQLPLALPDATNALTPWLHLNIHLAALIPLFLTLPAASSSSPATKKQKPIATISQTPSAAFASVSFVRMYANCRIRRLWFSRDGERTLRALGRDVAAEWGLYTSD